jgi:polar amino acid transport system permease protein
MNVEILFTYKDAIAAGILMTLKMSLGGILLGLAIGLCFFSSKDKNQLYLM